MTKRRESLSLLKLWILAKGDFSYDETAFMEPFQDIMSPEAAGPWGWSQPAGRETVRSSGFTRADGQFMAGKLRSIGSPYATNFILKMRTFWAVLLQATPAT